MDQASSKKRMMRIAKAIAGMTLLGGASLGAYQLLPGPSMSKVEPPMVAANGRVGILDGVKVELYGVSVGSLEDLAKFTGSQKPFYWAPDGSPYDGGAYTETPSFNYQQHIYEPPGASYGTRDTRVVWFRLQSDKPEKLLLYGYCPDTLVDGFDRNSYGSPGFFQEIELKPGSSLSVPAWTALRGKDSRRYIFGIAKGPWQEPDIVEGWPDRIEKDYTITRPWGTVTLKRHVFMAYSGPGYSGPHTDLIVSQNQQPRTKVFRVTLLDKDGKALFTMYDHFDQAVCIGTRGEFGGSSHENPWPLVKKIKVESLPLNYIKFNNIAFGPDPDKWKDVAVGSQGESDTQSIEGIGQFEAIAEASPLGAKLAFIKFYTPAGKRWVDYPTEKPGGEAQSPNQMRAFFKLQDVKRYWAEMDYTVSVSDSPQPDAKGDTVIGTRRVARLVAYDTFPSNLPYSCVQFDRPTTGKYLHFTIRVPQGEWKAVGTVKPDYGPLIKRDLITGPLAKVRETVTLTAFSVNLNDRGVLWFESQDQNQQQKKTKNLLTWNAEDNQARVVAHLKNGEQLVMGFGSYGAEFANCEFRLNPQSVPFHQFGKKPFTLADVEEFILETRSISKPVTFTARMPN